MITASHQPGDPRLVIDGDNRTSFTNGYDDWQFIQLDLGCVGEFRGLSRMMSYVTPTGRGSGDDWLTTDGDRQMQGETVSYSTDGRSFTFVGHGDTTGWENLGPYTSNTDAWHSVPYGWSPKLELNTAVQARFIRFHWDGDDDLLNELDVDVEVERAGLLTAWLQCLPGEPVCDVQAQGGHPGNYAFTWVTSGVFGGRQTDRAESSTLVGSCNAGAVFTVEVKVEDLRHGRSTVVRFSDRCATEELPRF